jgi:flagellar basal body rod protein FlgG
MKKILTKLSDGAIGRRYTSAMLFGKEIVFRIFFISGLLLPVLLDASFDPVYPEIQDPSYIRSAESLRAYQLRWQQLTQYTMNAGTPGFTELATYNYRDAEGRITSKPYFKFRAGPVVQTENELDFYLDAEGRGFFVIQLPNGIGFTKDGRFVLDSNRRLVTRAGNFPVLGESGEITLPVGNEIAVATTGQIYVDGETITRLNVVVFRSFEEMQNLSTLNGSVFYLVQPILTVSGVENFKIRQGFVEESSFMNVLVGDMHVARRGYEASAKAIKAISKAMGETAQLGAP